MRRKKLNKKGKLKAGRNALRKLAKVGGFSPIGAAMKVLSQPKQKEQMKNFLKKKNPGLLQTVGNDTEKLAAATVAQMREEMQQNYPMPYDEMPQEMQDQYDAEFLDGLELDEDTGSGEMENFLDPATLAAAKQLSGKVLGGIKKRRAEKGKGWFGQKLDKDGNVIPSDGLGKDLKEGLKEGAEVLEKEKTKQALRENSPLIIIVVVVIAVIGGAIAIAAAKNSKG